MSDVKQQFSEVAKAEDCSQFLIDSLEKQIYLLQNEIHFLREELKDKNHFLDLQSHLKLIDSSTTYLFIKENQPPLAENL